MRLTVADLMTQEPVAVSPECSAFRAIQSLVKTESTEIYVVDRQRRLLGVVPDYELLKAELSGEAREANVEQLMSRNVPVFTPESDAAEVARLFRDARYSRFPVVSMGKLVGVITRSDVIRLMAVLRRIDSPDVVKTRSAVRKPKLVDSPKARKRAKPVMDSHRPASLPAPRQSRRKVIV